MSARVCLLAIALLSCHDGLPSFVCAASDQCGAGGVCLEAACAFPDAACSSGLRWDVSAPGRVHACVALAAADMAMQPAPAADMSMDMSMVPLPPDLARPLGPDLAGSPCAARGCLPHETCGNYFNPDPTQVAYLTCCMIQSTLHCHAALGIGETCFASICQPAETCANGLPNGSSIPLEMVCCKSDASDLHCWTN